MFERQRIQGLWGEKPLNSLKGSVLLLVSLVRNES